MKKKIVISTTNDIATDQRMQRFCHTLHKAGYEITWVGRWKKNALPVNSKNFSTKRFVLLFNHGPLFYLSFNWRLFWFLLFSKADIFLAVDLDTAPAHFFASILMRKPLVIDSHEYFTGVPELNNRKMVQRIWKSAEKFIYKRVKYHITVNDSLKELFEKEYKVKWEVVKNFPLKPEGTPVPKNFPEGEIRIIYQGVLNKDRGLEETMMAFKKLPGNFKLIIAGDGDIAFQLKEWVMEEHMQHIITFTGKLAPDHLRTLTSKCHAGISPEKDTNINYRLALPNKIFDYLHAGLPIIISPLEEMKKITGHFHCGVTFSVHSPEHIAESIKNLFADKTVYESMSKNAVLSIPNLCWEMQEENIINFFENITSNHSQT
ncbi:MAG: glycosyltransferase [Bacteroidota bacterium]